MKYCSSCGAQCRDATNYCAGCGQHNVMGPDTPLPNYMETKIAFCKQCGEKASGRYCTACGTLLHGVELKNASFSFSGLGAAIPKIDFSAKAATPAALSNGAAAIKSSVKNKLGAFSRQDVTQGLQFTAAMTGISVLFSLLLTIVLLKDNGFEFFKNFCSIFELGYTLTPSVHIQALKMISATIKIISPTFVILFTWLGVLIAEKIRASIGKSNLRFQGLLCAGAFNAVVVTLISFLMNKTIKPDISDFGNSFLFYDMLDHMKNPVVLRIGYGFVLPLLTVFVVTFCLLALSSGFISRKKAEECHAPVLDFAAGGFRLFGNVTLIALPAMVICFFMAQITLETDGAFLINLLSVPFGFIFALLISGGSYNLFNLGISGDLPSRMGNPMGDTNQAFTVFDVSKLGSRVLTVFVMLAMVFLLIAAFRQIYLLWKQYETPNWMSAAKRGAAFAGTYALIMAVIGTFFRAGLSTSVKIKLNKSVKDAIRQYGGNIDEVPGDFRIHMEALGGEFIRNLLMIFILIFAIAMLSYFVSIKLQGKALLPVTLNRLLVPVMALVVALGVSVATNKMVSENSWILENMINGIENVVDDLDRLDEIINEAKEYFSPEMMMEGIDELLSNF